MRRMALGLALSCAVAIAACGSGSDTTDGGSGSGQPRRTATPVPSEPQDLYVDAEDGDDANPGTSPDAPLQTLVAAAKLLRPGTTVHVAPGRYEGRVTVNRIPGTAQLPVRFVAETTTGQAPAVIDAAEDTVAIAVTRSPYVSFEGFFITGAVPQTNPRVAATAVLIRTDSHHAVLRDCIVATGVDADGVRVNNSADVLIFNNLIFANDRGILITGDSDRTRVINNTVALHLRTGIVLGASNDVAPRSVMVVNNIVQESENDLSISVAGASQSTYDAHHNLVFQPFLEDQLDAYVPPEIRDETDVNADALFEGAGQGDVHLLPESPAIDAGAQLDAELTNALLAGSVTADGLADRVPLDLGYHYPRPQRSGRGAAVAALVASPG